MPSSSSSTSNCCRSLLAFHLKLLNFFQTFIGVSIIIYSVWMLNRWNKQPQILPPPPPPPPPPSSAPSPQSSSSPAALQLLNSQNYELFRAQFDYNHPLAAAGIVSGMDEDDNSIQFQLTKLPTPWFIYFMMGIGILLCSVTCIGHIASEAINGCCLCFYSLLTTGLILLEAAIVAFLIFDKRWEKDLPNDATGELESLRSFIEDNMDICKWLGIAVVIIQAFSLLLALILRGLVSIRNSEYDSDDDYAIIRDRSGQPLLNPQLSQVSGSTSTDSKANHSDIWSNRMRNKYGFHSGDVKYNLGDTNTSMVSTSNEDQRRCSIL